MKISPPQLKKILKDKGMTIKQFGDRLKMTREGVYDLMKRKNVKESMIQKVCAVLDVPREAFLLTENITPVAGTGAVDLEKENHYLKTITEKQNKIIELYEKLLASRERDALHTKKVLATGSKAKNGDKQKPAST